MLEAIAAIVTIASIYLATRQNVWYYPTGIVSVLLYAWIFFSAKLYAETALQFVWLALMVYGWYEWLHGGSAGGSSAVPPAAGPASERRASGPRHQLPVARTPRWGWISSIVTGALMTAVIVAIQRRYTDNPAPFVDSAIAAWSIVAQWMTARKWIENWLFWIAVNVVAVPLYVARELWITAALYFILLLLGIKGWRDWRVALHSRRA